MSDESGLTDTSVVVAVWHHLTARLAIENSLVNGKSQRYSIALSRALQTSKLAALSMALASWIHSSFLYRWLTAEPNPDIIVINLRETRTIGPILSVCDSAVGILARAWEAAGAGAVTDSTHDALRKHPVRTLSLVALGAILTNIVVSLVFGTFNTTELAIWIVAGTLAVLGTRIRVSWDQCTESAIVQYLVAVFEPPEPPSSEKPEGGSEP